MRFLGSFLLGGLLMALGLGRAEEKGKPMKGMKPGPGEKKQVEEMKVKGGTKPEPPMDPAPQPPPQPAR